MRTATARTRPDAGARRPSPGTGRRPAPVTVGRTMAVVGPVLWIAGVALGLPGGGHGGVPVGSGPSRTRCATTCRGRCRSARHARPLLP